jgi:hypothetical protein
VGSEQWAMNSEQCGTKDAKEFFLLYDFEK